MRLFHEGLPERDPLGDALARQVIDQLMRGLLAELFGEREHDPLGQQEAAEDIEIEAHLAGVDLKIRPGRIFICSRIAPVIRQASGNAFHSSRHTVASRSCSRTSASCIRGDGIAQRAADSDNAFAPHRIALVRHRSEPTLPSLWARLSSSILLCAKEDDLVGDLGESADDRPPRSQFGKSVARQVP